MTLSPDKLRSTIAATLATGGRCIALSIEDANVMVDGMEIADSAARADVESYSGQEMVGNIRFWNTQSAVGEDKEAVDKALKYLWGRGLIEPYSGNRSWVKFV
jgi:hypothetical protein